ncbi:MAG: hypothetical protein ACP5OU_01295 [Methanothrix sp.]
MEMPIGGIKTVIVDPHNEIVPYWFEEFLRQKRSLIAVRIDAHHDMFQFCPALPAREGRDSIHFLERLLPYIYHYSRSMINEGNFTCPAFHYGAVGALYHYHPGKERLDSYGRVFGSETYDAPETSDRCVSGGGRWIFWDGDATRLRGDEASPKTSPLPRRLSLDDLDRDMQDCRLPIALGIDLDGLYGNDDRGRAEDVVPRRLWSMERLLERVPRPAFICIARSQTPRSYIPAGAVDMVQEAALGLIRALYG